MEYPWGSDRRFNAWSDQCRQRFGTRVQKLSVNAGFSCPNRDGTVGWGGCTFCNNEGFSPSYCQPSKPIKQQIDEGLQFMRKRYPRAGKFLAYFQTYSNTYASLEKLKNIYEQALDHPHISGLVIGTRPDCVDAEKLDYLATLAGEYFIKLEYGVESCHDPTLKLINRGHCFADTQRAIAMTAERGLMTGIHMIFGLPGETRKQMLDQSATINELPIDTIKFHQLQIVKNTAMAQEYAMYPERYQLFDLDEYVDFVISFIERLSPHIAIDRFSGEIPTRLIEGKSWGRVRSDILLQMVENKMIERDTFQAKLCL